MGFCCSRHNADALPSIRRSVSRLNQAEVVLEPISVSQNSVEVEVETLLGEKITVDLVEGSLASIVLAATKAFAARYDNFGLFFEGSELGEKQITQRMKDRQKLVLTIVPRPKYDLVRDRIENQLGARKVRETKSTNRL